MLYTLLSSHCVLYLQIKFVFVYISECVRACRMSDNDTGGDQRHHVSAKRRHYTEDAVDNNLQVLVWNPGTHNDLQLVHGRYAVGSYVKRGRHFDSVRVTHRDVRSEHRCFGYYTAERRRWLHLCGDLYTERHRCRYVIHCYSFIADCGSVGHRSRVKWVNKSGWSRGSCDKIDPWAINSIEFQDRLQ